MLPQAASEFYADQQRRKLSTLIVVNRLWSKLDRTGSWSDQFPRLTLLMGAVIGRAQEDTARRADAYVAAVLAELDLPDSGGFPVNPGGFAGWTGAGIPVEEALGRSVAVAGSAYSQTLEQTGVADPAAALLVGANDLASRVSTIMADTARAAASAAIATRDGGGYVRMLTPPSCSRCVVLAGKFYRWNDGFQRHPKCDCVHVPATEDTARDTTTNPSEYFHSLSADEQDKSFTAAGAQAIRDGADITQVVNARAGMGVAQDLDGMKLFTTTAGTTKRGWFGGGYAARTYGDTDWWDQFGYARRKKTDLYRSANAVRLMPESIYELASDRDEAVRLLKRYGFITP